MIHQTATQYNFGALRQGAIEVYVLAGVRVGVLNVLDLVAKLVVAVYRAQRLPIAEQRLQHARRDGVVLLWLQVGSGKRGKATCDAGGLFEAGFFKPLRVAK